MKFYLKWVNPAVAISVLVICTWIWVGHYFIGFDKSPSPFSEGKNILTYDYITPYFFAKGLFCSSALFLLGVLAKKHFVDKSDSGKHAGDSKEG